MATASTSGQYEFWVERTDRWGDQRGWHCLLASEDRGKVVNYGKGFETAIGYTTSSGHSRIKGSEQAGYANWEIREPQQNLDNKQLGKTREILASIEKIFDKRIIGQQEAKADIKKLVAGKFLAVNKPKPLGILLAGPTGVGKTEIAKAIAESLNAQLTRFDMGEYSQDHKIANLFGSPLGYKGSDEGGLIPNAIRLANKEKKPLVILFDEIEKADPSIWQSLLGFCDEGRCHDTLGQTVAPKTTIILMTTNLCQEQIQHDPANARKILQSSGFLSREFLGRIEKVVPMNRLEGGDLQKLTRHLLEKLFHEYGAAFGSVEDSEIEKILGLISDDVKVYGGRGIKDKIQELLLDDLIPLMLEGHMKFSLTITDRITVIPEQEKPKYVGKVVSGELPIV